MVYFVFQGVVVQYIRKKAVEPSVESPFVVNDVLRIADSPRSATEVDDKSTVIAISIPPGQDSQVETTGPEVTICQSQSAPMAL
jgi:hypothetical protein